MDKPSNSVSVTFKVTGENAGKFLAFARDLAQVCNSGASRQLAVLSAGAEDSAAIETVGLEADKRPVRWFFDGDGSTKIEVTAGDETTPPVEDSLACEARLRLIRRGELVSHYDHIVVKTDRGEKECRPEEVQVGDVVELPVDDGEHEYALFRVLPDLGPVEAQVATVVAKLLESAEFDHEAVIRQLKAAGITATWEYPGYLDIPFVGKQGGLAVGTIDGYWGVDTFDPDLDGKDGATSLGLSLATAKLWDKFKAEGEAKTQPEELVEAIKLTFQELGGGPAKPQVEASARRLVASLLDGDLGGKVTVPNEKWVAWQEAPDKVTYEAYLSELGHDLRDPWHQDLPPKSEWKEVGTGGEERDTLSHWTVLAHPPGDDDLVELTIYRG